MQTPKIPLLLVILSGFGVYPKEDFYSYTPNINNFVSNYPATVLKTGEQVDSKIGHRIMGTGRNALSLEKKISSQIESGAFFNKEKIKEVENKTKETDKVHLFGTLTGPFKVDHLEACIKIAEKNSTQSYLHFIVNKEELDSVSVRQKLRRIKNIISSEKIKIASLISQNYTKGSGDCKELSDTYNVLTNKDSQHHFEDVIDFSKKDTNFKVAQKGDLNQKAQIEKNNVLIFCDYSGSDLRELVKSFSLPVYKFDRDYKELHTFTLVDYEKNIPAESIYSRNIFHDNLTEIIKRNDYSQFQITETVKHSYLNYYFKGNIVDVLSEDQTKIISSPNVSSFDNQPEMAIQEITRVFLSSLQQEHGVYIVELPNFEQMKKKKNKKKALKRIDKHVSKMVENVMIKGGSSIITADYKQKINEEELINNYVPFILVSSELQGLAFPKAKVPDSDLTLAKPTGDIRDISPTILRLLDIEVPEKMEKESLELEF